ncbi:MAG: host attachment protein [Burkholderiales bacterium]|nr:host attachment protein [Burkholderiales bacterium]
MASTWVVVADSSSARIFAAPTPTGGLEELASFVHPEGRMRAQELTSDLPGRAFDSVGAGRHAMESEVGPRAQAVIAFARQLASHLGAARARGEIERLVVAAAPEFLGRLRDALDDATRRVVEAELPLNLAKMTPAEIRARLPEKLYSTLATRK